MSAAWVESFLELNAEKAPGKRGEGRWRKVYREGDVRAVLDWANDRFREEDRLRVLLSLRFEANDARLNPKAAQQGEPK